jgi:hypothetical protein
MTPLLAAGPSFVSNSPKYGHWPQLAGLRRTLSVRLASFHFSACSRRARIDHLPCERPVPARADATAHQQKSDLNSCGE